MAVANAQSRRLQEDDDEPALLYQEHLVFQTSDDDEEDDGEGFPMMAIWMAVVLILAGWCCATCCEFNFKVKRCHLNCPGSCGVYMKNFSPCSQVARCLCKPCMSYKT